MFVTASASGVALALPELDRLARAHELILDAAGEGIFGVDLQGNITFINPAAARTIGWTREELVGQFRDWFVRRRRRSAGWPGRTS
jgi:PAS domain-containing protein